MNKHNAGLHAKAVARYKRIKKMREKTPRMKLQEIADREGCSRQRIFEILRRGAAESLV